MSHGDTYGLSIIGISFFDIDFSCCVCYIVNTTKTTRKREIAIIIEINTQSAIPIYEQLRNQIVLGIAANKLAPCENLPSVRSLAADLGINYLTVNKAYTMLSDEGYIVIDRRKGALVAKTVANNEAALSKIARQLTMTAAEAVCRNMSENDFVSLCTDSYKIAKGNPVNGGTL